MNFFSITLVLVVSWWLVFFMVLPWGMRKNTNEDPSVNAIGAPSKPLLIKKALITTGIAVILTVLFFYIGSLMEIRGITN
jgi:predicted secreted protein